MAVIKQNYPGPQQLRIFYTTAGYAHSMRLNINCTTSPAPGTAFSALTVNLSGGGTAQLDTYVDSWIALLRPMFSAATATIDFVDLWAYDPGTFDAVFISTYNVALAGTSGSSTQAAIYDKFTFRTLEGGVMNIILMESVATIGTSRAYSSLTAAEQAIVNHVIGTSNALLGMDTSYPYAFRRNFPHQNEALARRRYA